MNEHNSGGTWKLVVKLVFKTSIYFNDTVEAETEIRTEVSSFSPSNSFGKSTFDSHILYRYKKVNVPLVAISILIRKN